MRWWAGDGVDLPANPTLMMATDVVGGRIEDRQGTASTLMMITTMLTMLTDVNTPKGGVLTSSVNNTSGDDVDGC